VVPGTRGLLHSEIKLRVLSSLSGQLVCLHVLTKIIIGSVVVKKNLNFTSYKFSNVFKRSLNTLFSTTLKAFPSAKVDNSYKFCQVNLE